MSQLISILFIGSSPQYGVSILFGSFHFPIIRFGRDRAISGKTVNRTVASSMIKKKGKDALAMVTRSSLLSPLLTDLLPEHVPLELEFCQFLFLNADMPLVLEGCNSKNCAS
jgi:hypothetical protein